MKETAETFRSEPKLTRKGQATRERILECAADLIYRHGVQGTSNDTLRRAAGVSGSQLAHYFPDKETLVRATLAWRAESMMGLRQVPPRGPLDSMAALRAWADSYLKRPEVVAGGCSFGSLAAEVLKSDLDVRDAVAEGFARWRAQFVHGLTAMRDRGELRADADPDHLATTLMAAFQGGLLLTQAARDVQPLRQALDGALAHIEAHTTDRSS
jgi:TetR/AcrR family transcriptional regulator, transcriptional repressor for nem operon